MTPAEETRLRGMEERVKIVADSYFEHADWTIKQFQHVLNMIFGLTVAQAIALVLILALMARAHMMQ